LFSIIVLFKDWYGRFFTGFLPAEMNYKTFTMILPFYDFSVYIRIAII